MTPTVSESTGLCCFPDWCCYPWQKAQGSVPRGCLVCGVCSVRAVHNAKTCLDGVFLQAVLARYPKAISKATVQSLWVKGFNSPTPGAVQGDPRICLPPSLLLQMPGISTNEDIKPEKLKSPFRGASSNLDRRVDVCCLQEVRHRRASPWLAARRGISILYYLYHQDSL